MGSGAKRMKGLTLRGVKKRYGQVEVIHGVDLDIEPGEFAVFVGPSGCGKSTLLRMVAGLEEITSGDLSIGDVRMNDVDPSERGVAMVFQTYALYPHMTVEQNMGFGLRMNKRPKDEIKKRIDIAAKILRLEPYLDRKPKALSGGQRQRVAIGRAIVREPDVFLFDEPLSNLDAELRVATRVEIAKLHKDLKATMIYVTHDQTEAMTLADKIVVLRDGVIEQVGAPLSLYGDPDNMFVAGFIGSPRMNFFKATAISNNGTTYTFELADYKGVSFEKALNSSLAPGASIMVGIRPEHFSHDGQTGIPLDIDVVEHLGGTAYLYANSQSEAPTIVEMRDEASLKEGAFEARFNAADAYIFHEDTGLRVR